MAIRHIFFDLDRTLWDFERNSHDTISELYSENNLKALIGADVLDFITLYKDINERCWEDYRLGRIQKSELRLIRFRKALEFYGVADKALADNLGEAYLQRCPMKTALFPETHEVLTKLALNCDLHIITNGFEEVQHVKMQASGLTDYFKIVMTSERAGCKKPDTDIFIKAMSESGAQPGNSLMIGDHYEVDVVGAENVGMKAVLFDPENLRVSDVRNRISNLNELHDWV